MFAYMASFLRGGGGDFEGDNSFCSFTHQERVFYTLGLLKMIATVYIVIPFAENFSHDNYVVLK